MTPKPASYPGYRFPAEIISQAVWGSVASFAAGPDWGEASVWRDGS
jgi:hypothetical protein